MTKVQLGLIAAVSMAFASCKAPPQTQLEPVSLLLGTYDNAAQFEAADDALKITPKIGDTRVWIDLQHARFLTVDVPAIPGTVVGLEWRKGGVDGPISRQRLWAFRMDLANPVMEFYGFKGEVDMNSPAALAALTQDDLIAYGDACALPIIAGDGGYMMTIPQTCQITTQSGRKMTLSATIKVTGEMLSYEEAGISADGTPVFAVPGQMAYAFKRVR
ncbi:MAG: hypothetical protein AAF337_07970 [Pseudomonadota bacterium]